MWVLVGVGYFVIAMITSTLFKWGAREPDSGIAVVLGMFWPIVPVILLIAIVDQVPAWWVEKHPNTRR